MTHPRFEDPAIDWDYFILDGFQWTDLLHCLAVPHWSNDHRTDQPPILFEVRTVTLTYLYPGDDNKGEPTQLIIIWKPETERPTDEQIQTIWSKDS